MKHSTKLLVLVASIVGALSVAGAGWAYWTSSGSGTASATVGTLNAPTVTALSTPVHSPVTVSWTAPGAPSVDPTGYYVQRFVGATPTAVCGSPAGSLLPATPTSCSDIGVPEGTYTYKVTAVFKSSWTALSASSNSVTVDNTAPVTTDNASSVWASSRTVTLTANDTGGSGVSTTYYTTNGSPPTTSSSQGTSITLSAQGTYTIKYFSVDVAGNTEAVKTAANQVRIDTAAPVTTDNATSTWTKTAQTVTLTPADTGGSGVATTYYTTDGVDPTTNSSSGTSVVLSADGTYTIKYFSVDVAGNAEAVKTAANQVRIDTTSPTLTITRTGSNVSYPGSGTTVYFKNGGSGSFTITAADPESGIASASFPDAPSGWTKATGTNSATYTLALAAASSSLANVSGTNNAGAVTTQTVTITLDNVAPTGGSVTYPDGYVTASPTSVSFTAGTDAGSGVNVASGILQRAQATLTSGTCGTYGSFTTVASNQTSPYSDTVASGNCYKYQYLIFDNAGNQATYTSASVAKVDTNAPTASDIQTTNNGNTPGLAQKTDVITFTFSEAINPGSIRSGWNGTATGLNGLWFDARIYDGGGSNDYVEIWDDATATKVAGFGRIELGRTDYVTGGAGTFLTFGDGSNSKGSTTTVSGTTVQIVLGTLANVNTGTPGTVTVNGTMVWTPGTTFTDLAGNSMLATSATESGAPADREF